VARGPYRGDDVLQNIKLLVAACRGAGVEVIYVQHDGEPGGDEEPETPGWEIHGGIAPRAGEKVVRKRFNSAFRGTDLRMHLDTRGVSALILVGIQTEYCVDTTCRVAFEHGYGLIMPELTNTTYDSDTLSGRQIYEHHNERIFRSRFASVPTMAEALEALSSGGWGP